MDPTGSAILYRRSGGTLIERWVASGTMIRMVKRVMHEPSDKRRDFIILHDGMEYQSAEILNLASQYTFSDSYRREVGKPAVVVKKPRK